jgi:hypothetical protein
MIRCTVQINKATGSAIARSPRMQQDRQQRQPQHQRLPA